MTTTARRWWNSGYTRLAILTALAAVIAYALAEVIPFADPIPAAITAAVATRATFHHAAKETVFQILGALLGATLALGVVFLIGSGPAIIFLLILMAFALAKWLPIGTREEAQFIAGGMAVTMILVVGTHFTTELAIERFAGVVIGALLALAASYFATPVKDTRVLRQRLDALQHDLAVLLSDMAEGLRQAPDGAQAAGWLDEAVELRNRSLGLDAQFEDLKSHTKWSPRIDPDDIDDLERSLTANRVMSSRVLSIASDLSQAAGSSSATAIPQAALSPLADLIAMAADNIEAEDPATSIGATAAHEAVRQADATAQIALIGGIVSHVNQINRATAEHADGEEEDDRPGST